MKVIKRRYRVYSHFRTVEGRTGLHAARPGFFSRSLSGSCDAQTYFLAVNAGLLLYVFWTTPGRPEPATFADVKFVTKLSPSVGIIIIPAGGLSYLQFAKLHLCTIQKIFMKEGF